MACAFYISVTKKKKKKKTMALRYSKEIVQLLIEKILTAQIVYFRHSTADDFRFAWHHSLFLIKPKGVFCDVAQWTMIFLRVRLISKFKPKVFIPVFTCL